MQAIVHSADMQDRAGGVLLMASLFGLYPFLLRLYADGGYQGPRFRDGLARVCRQVRVEIVRRSDASGFVVLPRRWIVERTIAWLNRCRRLVKDYERYASTLADMHRIAFVCLMLKTGCSTARNFITASSHRGVQPGRAQTLVQAAKMPGHLKP